MLAAIGAWEIVKGMAKLGGYAHADLDSDHLTCYAVLYDPTGARLRGGDRSSPATTVTARSRPVHLERWLEGTVHDLAALPPRHEVKSATTTVLIRAGERALATPECWLDIRLA